MAQDTVRDRIWSHTLIRTHRKGEAVRPDDLVDDLGVSEKTARDTLICISGTPFVRRDIGPDGSVRYLPDGDLEK